MKSFIALDGEEFNFIWDSVQERQLIFHPTIAPDGKFDFDKFFESMQKKPFILFLDRNILSGLLAFCEKGTLRDETEARLVGLIMAWAEMNDIAISAGLAVRERATQLNSQNEGLIELQKFLEAFHAHPGQLWLRVAEGEIVNIPPITYSLSPAKDITVNYADGGDHYDMAVASLLHIVKLYKNKSLKPFDKMIDLFQWMCDNILVSEYILIYAAMLFTSQEYIRAPKNANSNDIEKVVAGCENQAWDIAYLTNWSTLYSNTDNYAEEFLFATNDIMLKRIFIKKNGPNGFNGVLYEAFSIKEYNQLMDFIEERMRKRVKPNFGEDTHAYFQKLIDEEKKQLYLC